MCGIYGVVDPHELPAPSVFAQMDHLIFHRGPDDGGLHREAPVALGARRLAILDLSPAGHQPMSTADGRYTLVYNGEVYNYRELRKSLEYRGVVFRSGSDTEVVLQALALDGAAALEKLSGMFALALWDRERKELLLARDRFGIKPLYLYQDGARLCFASELKAILALPGIDRSLDPEALGLYLTLGFVPGARTLFRRIRKALPGTAYRFAEGELRAHAFWRLREGEPPTGDVLAEFEERLGRVVERHLLADVPVGVFLSGGLDSSALVVAIRELMGLSSKTFTIGFGDPRYSEASHARLVAERFGSQHREMIIEPDALEVLPRIVWHLEEPIADSSILPLWFLCGLAREDVTVALSGDGGDETLGGYTRYLWAPVAQTYGLLPATLRESLLPRLASLLPGGEKRGLLNVGRRVRKFFETGRLDKVPRYLAWFALFDEAERRALVPSAGGDPEQSFAELFRAAGTSDPLRELQYVDINSMLVDNLLLKGDKLSMAHSLEVRVPFLDPELAQFGYDLPGHWKITGRTTKRLLRKWLAQRAPREITRRPKQGFEVPIGAWFRGNLEGFARELLLGGELRAQGLVDEDALTALLARQQNVDLGQQILGLVVLEYFFRTFMPKGLP